MKYILTSVLILISLNTFAKRGPSPEITPVKLRGLSYAPVIEPLTTGCPADKQNCGHRIYLEATNLKTKKVAWKTELYQLKFDMKLETDVQANLPKTLKVNKDKNILLIDEWNSHYIVTSKSGKLIHPTVVTVYDGKGNVGP
ncbi:MAG: hypothetical protein V4736_16530 [Bdellovibrionota bacterium]